jgi:hypothetical protein
MLAVSLSTVDSEQISGGFGAVRHGPASCYGYPHFAAPSPVMDNDAQNAGQGRRAANAPFRD